MDAAERRAICARIAQARREAGFSQPQFAELLHVHKRTVENYEHGRVPWDRLEDIAQLTGRTREWLIRGDVSDDGREKLRELLREELGPVLVPVLEALARLEARLTDEEDPPAPSERAE